MAESLTATLQFTLNATLDGGDALSTLTDVLSYTVQNALTSGTGLNKADRMWHSQRTLAATTAETLDLAGSLTDALGNAFSPTSVKAIIVRNRSTTVGNILVVGGAASNAWTAWTSVAGSTVKIGPNGYVALVDPSLAAYDVTAGTGDQLKINNLGSTPTTYDLIIIGVSAETT